MLWHGRFELECRDAAGRLKWREEAHNKLLQPGGQWIWKTLFQDGTLPSNYYLALYKSTAGADIDAILDTATLSSLSAYEAAGESGYARIALAHGLTDWPTNQIVSSQAEVSSKTYTFTATGAWAGIVRFIGLATTSDNTGTLISIAQITDRVMATSDVITGVYKMALGQGA